MYGEEEERMGMDDDDDVVVVVAVLSAFPIFNPCRPLLFFNYQHLCHTIIHALLLLLFSFSFLIFSFLFQSMGTTLKVKRVLGIQRNF